ncbi:hypothetical protein [Paracoccus sp. MC1862]|uniref:hypothetical protein n=1 Tax=Paracoccus sp. MC1862 TaxID=2760307 RepID=UPI001F1C494C|nr:hypothetical protein [Paracoccus sp. MC1862]
MERQIETVARKMATAAAGERNTTLNGRAFWLGQAVAGEWMDEATVRAALDAGLEPGEVEATISSGLEAWAKTPRPTTVPPKFEYGYDALARWLGSEGCKKAASFFPTP